MEVTMPRPIRLEKEIIEADQAIDILAKKDKKLAKVIEKCQRFRLEIPHLQTTFEALAESIVYQQLTGKAAASIFNRLKIVTGETAFPTPAELLALPQSTLRGVGLSQAKTLALLDLSARTKAGLVPSADQMHKMSDEELVESLTAIRGIGRWTVDMILIFRLGRLDVMPAGDYGVRKGFALTYNLEELPTAKELYAYAERWRPYRTVGSWYMWRAIELYKESAKAKAESAKTKPGGSKAKAELAKAATEKQASRYTK